MKFKSSLTVRKIAELSLFLAMGIILNIVESFIPIPIPVPGIKLGIANTIGLVVLYYYGIKEYLLVGGLRVFIVALIRTGLFSTANLLSLSGFILSSIIAIIIYLTKRFSIYSLSVASSIFHCIGQMIVVMIIYSSRGLIIYLPILMITGTITGLLLALITSLILQRLNKALIKEKSLDSDTQN